MTADKTVPTGGSNLLAGFSKVERALFVAVALATVGAGVARYVSGVPHVLAFVVAGLALAGDAWIVSVAIEQIGRRFGPAVTGMMQATLGNLPEFFVVLFALNARQLVVAQTAILGSILVNALLVLGLVVLAGARYEPDNVMRFRRRLPLDTTTLLFVSSFIIVLIGLVQSSQAAARRHIEAISIVGAIAILIVYGTWLLQYLRADEQPAAPGDDDEPMQPMGLSLGLLIYAGVASAFVSDWFVHALQPTIQSVHISQSFAGLVIVAIAGNAVENVAGIAMAARGHHDLAISVVKNSVSQIAAFLFPLLVLVSLLTTTQLTFAVAPIYIGALLGTAVIVWQITGDGEATPFEGAALIAAYVILATVAAFD